MSTIISIVIGSWLCISNHGDKDPHMKPIAYYSYHVKKGLDMMTNKTITRADKVLALASAADGLTPIMGKLNIPINTVRAYKDNPDKIKKAQWARIEALAKIYNDLKDKGLPGLVSACLSLPGWYRLVLAYLGLPSP